MSVIGPVERFDLSAVPVNVFDPNGKDSMLKSVTYVSRSHLLERGADDLVRNIVAASIAWNAAHGITGGLLFTGRLFAQTLEGEESEVISLVDRIQRNARHEGMQIIHRGVLTTREFSSWWMAYRGRTSFVDRKVEAARSDSRLLSTTSPDELKELIKMFALQRALLEEPGMRAEPSR